MRARRALADPSHMVFRSRVARLLVRILFALLFRVRTSGALPDRGPLLVVANHQGWADGFLLAAAFPLRARVRLLADRDGTLGVWWHQLVLDSLGLVIPIDRTASGADRHALTDVLEALSRNEIVVVFAEGRVSHAESALAPFARGVGYLALRAGVPVLPVWLAGTAELYLGRELEVIAGRPRPVSSAAPTKQATIDLANAMHDDLAALAPIWQEPSGRKTLRWLTDLF
jgi:1-acyl-sn-glycerol-3-phosphate acyltransferase